MNRYVLGALAALAILVAAPTAASAQFADSPGAARPTTPLHRGEDGPTSGQPTTCAELATAYTIAAGEVLELLARSHAPAAVQEAAANTREFAALLLLLELRQEDVAHRNLAETLNLLDHLPLTARCSA